MLRIMLLMKPELKARCQALADVETEGALNPMLRKLLGEALAMRSYPQHVVMGMGQYEQHLTDVASR